MRIFLINLCRYQGEKSMKPVALLVGEDGFDVGIGGAHYVINKNYAECTKRMGAVPYLAYDIRNAEDYVKFANIFIRHGITVIIRILRRWRG